MQQLSGLDNTFLTMEAGGQLGHVASLCMYDVSKMKGESLHDAIERTLKERMHLLPPYRRRLAAVAGKEGDPAAVPFSLPRG